MPAPHNNQNDMKIMNGPDGVHVELNYTLEWSDASKSKTHWKPTATVLIKYHGASYEDAIRYGWLGSEEMELTEEQLSWLKSIENQIRAHDKTQPAGSL